MRSLETCKKDPSLLFHNVEMRGYESILEVGGEANRTSLIAPLMEVGGEADVSKSSAKG